MKYFRTYLLSILLVGLFAIPSLAAGVPPDGTVNNCEVKKVVCINKATGQKTVGVVTPDSWNCGPDFSQNDGDKVVIKIICLSREPAACVGQTCGTYTGDCNPDIGPCYCWMKADGTTLCGNDFWCDTGEACASDANCPAGKECIIGSCCGGNPGVCAPTICDGTIWGGAEGDGGSSATGR